MHNILGNYGLPSGFVPADGGSVEVEVEVEVYSA